MACLPLPVLFPVTAEEGTTYETSISFSQFENTCASGPGGPGLNRGDDSAGRSTLGTTWVSERLQYHSSINRQETRSQATARRDAPINPCFGRAESGSATSAFIPHTMVVLPIRTSADPCAVDIDPRQSVNARWNRLPGWVGDVRIVSSATVV
jgi:hypothetical protein